MEMLGTWPHEGNVNFVVASKNGSGLVATAADVPSEAVRVYYVTDDDVSSSPYRTFSGSRTWNEDDKDTKEPQKWAYYPATMQWGIAPEVQHLLLVGYSPRSFSVHDDDIPEGKRHSGEICLWDCITGERRKVLTATTQNVFEVAWHPTQPSFIVATSPSGLHVDEHVRTQIRIFRPTDSPDEIGAYTEVQCLDCTASDINELTIMPCSMSHCYVTAAATDGNVYVWDTARGDEPVKVLCHDAPVEESSGDFYERERDDTGVKFTAWGTSQDRFYTGGSDGMVKVWNVRNLGNPLVRDLLEAPGPISFGAFSPDRSKLAIGDATGRVFLLSVDEADQQPADCVEVVSSRMGHLALDSKRRRRRPMGFRPHATPPAPEGMEPTSGVREARKYLEAGQLRIHKNPCIGAVQGERYATLGMYHAELHKDGDPLQPLVGSVDQEQRENATMYSQRLRTLRVPPPPSTDALERHRWNAALDLDLRALPALTQQELEQSGVGLDDFADDAAWDFEYEEE
ncbi:hypothetical protein ACRALDRAFT_1065021 [Sodiomyces alcalophilus JCM 7366]|uniref:uncharacterized protein n=1 Tax=Sodiomyces alcalophilus JCM 7366 TaxID=591952 RepID=UPI0039B61E76